MHFLPSCFDKLDAPQVYGSPAVGVWPAKSITGSSQLRPDLAHLVCDSGGLGDRGESVVGVGRDGIFGGDGVAGDPGRAS